MKYSTTKPGFIKKRMQILFDSDDIVSQQSIVDKYNDIRKNSCYCGHTTICDCGDPGISEFKNSLNTCGISEKILEKIFNKKHNE